MPALNFASSVNRITLSIPMYLLENLHNFSVEQEMPMH